MQNVYKTVVPPLTLPAVQRGMDSPVIEEVESLQCHPAAIATRMHEHFVDIAINCPYCCRCATCYLLLTWAQGSAVHLRPSLRLTAYRAPAAGPADLGSFIVQFVSYMHKQVRSIP